MVWHKIFRVLRKRIVLGIIFAVSFVYCFVSVVKEFQLEQVQNVGPEVDHGKVALRPNVEFQWHSGSENSSSNKEISCRNSIQGKILITDDKGYVCSRHDVLPNGCCDPKALKKYKRYSCETCQGSGCCNIYEYCISCCLDPTKKILLQGILSRASETFHLLFASVADHFELCVTKCRTSSQSVQHENSYRDPKAKHCFGDLLPTIQPVAQ